MFEILQLQNLKNALASKLGKLHLIEKWLILAIFFLILASAYRQMPLLFLFKFIFWGVNNFNDNFETILTITQGEVWYNYLYQKRSNLIFLWNIASNNLISHICIRSHKSYLVVTNKILKCTAYFYILYFNII